MAVNLDAEGTKGHIICVDTTVVKIELHFITCVEYISHGSGCIQYQHQVKLPKTSSKRSEMSVRAAV